MLFFGLETTFRSLQRKAFSSQSRRHFWFCIVGILLLTIITWIPSAFSPTKGKCVTSLIWWTFHYARAGVAICLVLIFAFVTSASVITFQLLGTTKIDRGQRVQASRIVYHLIASTLILVSSTSITVTSANEETVSNSSLLCRSHNDETCDQRSKVGSGSSKHDRPDTGVLPHFASIQCRLDHDPSDWELLVA